MKIPQNPPQPNTPSGDVATQQWVSTYYATKSGGATTYRKTTTKQVVNTLTVTDLLNGEITVGAGVMGAKGVLRLTAWGDVTQNSGATQTTPSFRLVLGGTTLLNTGTLAGAWGTTTVIYPFRCVCEIQNRGAANSQWESMELIYGPTPVATNSNFFATGEGIYVAPSSGTFCAIGGNSSTVDTTIAQVLQFQVGLPVANANVAVTLAGALVEII